MTLTVALLSLEPWDEVWRRNQHLAVELVRSGAVREIIFVEPPSRSRRPAFSPIDGITVVPTRRPLPNRAGGTRILARFLRRRVLRRAYLLWINDPTLGAAALEPGQPAIYDVTDDWRTVSGAPRAARRVVHAEDLLAGHATTVVCSEVLRRRWQERYGVTPAVVHNAVDAEAWSSVVAEPPDGHGPHLGYVGSLHDERLDVPLLLSLADALTGSALLHLVGPSYLTASSTEALRGHPRIRMHGSVPASRVPAITKGLDVLLCPHRVTPFTMSLDAIKSYEYLASGRRIVATPTSGFQDLAAPQLSVVDGEGFVGAVQSKLSGGTVRSDINVPSWSERAAEFRAAWPC